MSTLALGYLTILVLCVVSDSAHTGDLPKSFWENEDFRDKKGDRNEQARFRNIDTKDWEDVDLDGFIKRDIFDFLRWKNFIKKGVDDRKSANFWDGDDAEDYDGVKSNGLTKRDMSNYFKWKYGMNI